MEILNLSNTNLSTLPGGWHNAIVTNASARIWLMRKPFCPSHTDGSWVLEKPKPERKINPKSIKSNPTRTYNKNQAKPDIWNLENLKEYIYSLSKLCKIVTKILPEPDPTRLWLLLPKFITTTKPTTTIRVIGHGVSHVFT